MVAVRNVLFFSAVIFLNSCIDNETRQSKVDIEAGQVWKYINRPGDENSSIIILGIESFDTATVVYVRVDSIKCSGLVGNDSITSIQYLPFSKEAILGSITTLMHRKVPFPDYKLLADEWYELWVGGKATFYTGQVKNAVDTYCKRDKTRPLLETSQ